MNNAIAHMDIQKNEQRSAEEKNVSESPVEVSPKHTSEKAFGTLRSALLGGILGGIFGALIVASFSPTVQDVVTDFMKSKDLTQTEIQETITRTLVDEESATISVVENALPGVVSIVAEKDVPIYRNNPFDFFFDPFSLPDEGGSFDRQRVGGGTGFFVTEDGMIITNRHVVSDARAEYTVITQDGKEYPAEILARDPNRDIAFIKVQGNGFPALTLGDSSSLKVGQTVIAIGNSLGEFANSVSRGIVSGLGRDIVAGSYFGESEYLRGIIQTDAAINPGNSGGPLLDIQGRVIGVNTAVAQGAENVGFALPIDSIKNSISQVKETGEIVTPFLGVRYVMVNEAIQAENNLRYDYGALVLRGENRTDLAVIPGSPADKAGIEELDIILEVNGQKIEGENGLAEALSSFGVGETVTLLVSHNGEEKEVSVTLDKRT